MRALYGALDTVGAFICRTWNFSHSESLAPRRIRAMRIRFVIAALCSSLGLFSLPTHAQDGAVLYKDHCAICHESGTSGDSRAPGRAVLSQMTPEQILQALEKGAMKLQAAERSRAQRLALAEYLSGKAFTSE